MRVKAFVIPGPSTLYWSWKAPKCYGEGGIRTLGTLLRYNALAKRRFRPLSHLTKRKAKGYTREQHRQINNAASAGNGECGDW
jgi:hypothetical protein